MILNEFDACLAALKKVKLDEEVMPIHNGRVLTENVDTYCKIQKLLGCQAFEQAHRWLYDLDVENLDESENSKVCNLYQLGVERGYIDDDSADDELSSSSDNAMSTDVTVSADITPAPAAAPEEKPAPQSAYVIMYSAMRDGQIKTGEAYSNALNTRSAKADVISKLEKAGYQNISILAIEAGDPDMTGCDNTFCKQSDYAVPSYESEEDDSSEEVTERYWGRGGLGVPGKKRLDDPSPADMAAWSNTMDHEFMQKRDEKKAQEAVKKAFDEANKEVGDGIAPQDVKQILDYKDEIKRVKDTLIRQHASKYTLDSYDKIIQFLQDYADGKLAAVPEGEELDEAGKPSTGVGMIARGLVKLLLTLFKLSAWGIGLSGKLLVWVTDMIAAGADKLNVMVKDSEDEEGQVNEDGEEDSEDNSSEDSEEGSEEEGSSEEDDAEDGDAGDSKDDKPDDDDEEDKKEEDAEEPDEKLKADKKAEDGEEDASDDKDEKDLSDQEKTQLKDSYKKAFKAAMQKCKYFDKSFDDLTLSEKVKFFETIDEAWKGKADPAKFMSDKETEQLQKIVIKK